MVALERYARIRARRGCDGLTRDFYKTIGESGGKKGKRGRRNVDDTHTSGELIKKIEKLYCYLSMLTRVLSRANSPHPIPGDMCKYITKYNQIIAEYNGSLRADGPSMQKCPRGIRQIAYDVQEAVGWDVEMAHFAFLPRAVEVRMSA